MGLIFLQKFPDELELEQLKSEILDIELIEEIHALKGWSIDDTSYYLRFHVMVPEDTNIRMIDELKDKIKEILKKHNVTYSTLEFESSHYNTPECHNLD